MNDDNRKLDDALERLDALTKEIHKIKLALNSASEGVPFSEAWDEEVYLEDANAIDKTTAYLARMMQHLLKIKYSISSLYVDDWTKEVEDYQNRLIDITRWINEKKRFTNVINHLTDDLDEIYKDAVNLYKKDARKYEDLQWNIKYIPEECPWAFMELMDETINELLEKLPDWRE
jgi:hypothetical protein